MGRMPRVACESDIYHVYVRGTGRQLIFEDEADRRYLLSLLKRLSRSFGISMMAWALMGNHIHLLIHAQIDVVSRFMQRMQTSYSCHFNRRHDRVGHLFQGRFGSQPILDDEQLKLTVRYIHLNPVKGGLSTSLDYPWSSYREYIAQSGFCDTGVVLGLFSGIDEFRKFHEAITGAQPGDDRSNAGKYGDMDDAILQAVEEELGPDWHRAFEGASKAERNDRIRALRARGLSVRQIARLTGIGRGIIQRC